MSLPTKRSSGATSSSSSPSTSMKKAKSSSTFDDVVFDSSMDDDLKPTDLPRGGAASNMAANLARKKATPPQPAKKLLIRLHKGNPTVPSNFEDKTWAILKSAICAIFLKQPDSCDLEKLYQAVNDLCIHKMGGNLYQRIEKECEVHISAALQSLVGQSPDLIVFLSLVERCWQDLCDQMLMIRGIALFLDRTYVKQSPNIRSIWDMGLQIFRKHLSLSPEVQHKTVTGLLRMIDSERLLKKVLPASRFLNTSGQAQCA